MVALAALALPSLAPVPIAHAQDQPGVVRLLVDTRLASRPITVRSLDLRTLTYTDAAGLIRTEPIADYLALLPLPEDRPLPRPRTAARPETPAPTRANMRFAPDADQPEPIETAQTPTPTPPQPPPRVAVDLTDARRFVGVLADSAEPDALRLEHPLLGTLAASLDDIRALRVGSVAPAQGLPSADVLLLANGDRLEGLAESLGRTITFARAGQPAATFTIDRVQQVLLANPPRPPSGVMVFLADGSAVRVAALRTTRLGDLELTPDSSEAAPSRPIRLADLRAVVFDASRLVPLASQPVRVTPGPDRRWAPPATPLHVAESPLGLGDVDLSGPVDASWPVPAGATRFAAMLELPRAAWAWGRVAATLHAVDQAGRESPPLAAADLAESSPTAALAAELPPAARLLIRLRPGETGPVHNRVIVRSGMFLLSPGPGGR